MLAYRHDGEKGLKDMNLSSTKIQETLYSIERKAMHLIGVDEADRAMYALRWYVLSGRAWSGWVLALCSTNSRQQTMIAKRLIAGRFGSIAETVAGITEYLTRCFPELV